MRRGGVADPGARRHFTNRQRLRPAFLDQLDPQAGALRQRKEPGLAQDRLFQELVPKRILVRGALADQEIRRRRAQVQRRGDVDRRAHADVRRPRGLVAVGQQGDLFSLRDAARPADVGQQDVDRPRRQPARPCVRRVIACRGQQAINAKKQAQATDELRREIDPVPPALFLRFLAGWQHLLPDTQVAGLQGLGELIEQAVEVVECRHHVGLLPAEGRAVEFGDALAGLFHHLVPVRLGHRQRRMIGP